MPTRARGKRPEYGRITMIDKEIKKQLFYVYDLALYTNDDLLIQAIKELEKMLNSIK